MTVTPRQRVRDDGIGGMIFSSELGIEKRCSGQKVFSRGSRPPDEVAHELLADQVLQRLGRAAAERAVARAAIEARNRVLVGEAVAAVDLHRLAGDADRHLVAEHLRDGRFVGIGERVGGERRRDRAGCGPPRYRGTCRRASSACPGSPPIALAEDRAVAHILDRFLEGALRPCPSEMLGLRQRCVLNAAAAF